ncbi:TlpA family protein disulfide reductase [Ekhidna sp.]
MNKSIVLLMLVLSINSQGQSEKKSYFKDAKSGLILNEVEYQKAKEKKSEELKKYKDLILKETFIDSVVTSDSIINTFKLGYKIDLQAKIDREEKSAKKWIGQQFTFSDLNTVAGEKIKSEMLNGKPTLINIWYVACKPCIEEMPILNNIASTYSEKVNFISISYDSKESVAKFLQKRDFNFSHHIVNAKSLIDELGIQSYPKNILLDKNGVITQIEDGIHYQKINGKSVIGNGEELIKLIERLL